MVAGSGINAALPVQLPDAKTGNDHPAMTGLATTMATAAAHRKTIAASPVIREPAQYQRTNERIISS